MKVSTLEKVEKLYQRGTVRNKISFLDNDHLQFILKMSTFHVKKKLALRNVTEKLTVDMGWGWQVEKCRSLKVE